MDSWLDCSFDSWFDCSLVDCSFDCSFDSSFLFELSPASVLLDSSVFSSLDSFVDSSAGELSMLLSSETSLDSEALFSETSSAGLSSTCSFDCSEDSSLTSGADSWVLDCSLVSSETFSEGQFPSSLLVCSLLSSLDS